MFDYIDRDSYDEVTLAGNRSAFDRYAFRQRVLVDVSHRDLASEMLGESVSLPLAFGPSSAARPGPVCHQLLLWA
jgi:L-lactate dehydrogenase (cytochrome)